MDVTRDEVEQLLENFAEYVNPAGEEDPWFTFEQVKQQFAVPSSDALFHQYLDELVAEGKVESSQAAAHTEKVWRWLS